MNCMKALTSQKFYLDSTLEISGWLDSMISWSLNRLGWSYKYETNLPGPGWSDVHHPPGLVWYAVWAGLDMVWYGVHHTGLV